MSAKSIEEVLREKKIHQIAESKLVQASPSISVKHAVELMRTNKSGYVAITERGKILGLFTEKDVVNKVMGESVSWDAPALESMTPCPVSLTPEDSVYNAVETMSREGLYHIPLTGPDGNLSGVLSVRMIIRFLAAFYPAEVYNLPPNIHQIMTTPEGG
ncbi:MAG: CBS domain-containing protein [Candidatus Omnitrophica bacterium]|nr:CBS domain-containing protein [Candidatus Omnitrophota bacterium]